MAAEAVWAEAVLLSVLPHDGHLQNELISVVAGVVHSRGTDLSLFTVVESCLPGCQNLMLTM